MPPLAHAHARRLGWPPAQVYHTPAPNTFQLTMVLFAITIPSLFFLYTLPLHLVVSCGCWGGLFRAPPTTRLRGPHAHCLP